MRERKESSSCFKKQEPRTKEEVVSTEKDNETENDELKNEIASLLKKKEEESLVAHYRE